MWNGEKEAKVLFIYLFQKSLWWLYYAAEILKDHKEKWDYGGVKGAKTRVTEQKAAHRIGLLPRGII